MRTAVIVSVTSLIAVMVLAVMALIAIGKDVTTAIALVSVVLSGSVPSILALAKTDKVQDAQREHGAKLASVERKVNGQMTALATAAGIPPSTVLPSADLYNVDAAQKSAGDSLP